VGKGEAEEATVKEVKGTAEEEGKETAVKRAKAARREE